MYSVLIVEDNKSILDMLEAVFNSIGAEVSTAEDGQKACDYLQSERPDIILLDVILPEIDGFTLLEKLRKQGITTPVILITDKKLVEDKVNGLNLGADDYITKPFSTKELLARVNAQLRRSRLSSTAESNSINIGNLQISINTREVRLLSGDLINLTKTEFDLLSYLAERKQQIVKHEELLENVLQYQSTVETKALAMHVANLRKKLNKAFAAGVNIKATPGVGYRILEV